MHEVEVIKANRKISDRTAGKVADILRVAPYARVSTDSEEQLNSYKSQVMYYTDLVKKRKDWVLVDIYADEAITGTQVTSVNTLVLLAVFRFPFNGMKKYKI